MPSIEKRGKQSWRLTIEVGMKAVTDEDGKAKIVRDKRTKTIKVEDKALLRTTKKLQEYLEGELYKFKIEVESGEYIAPQKTTLKTFVEETWDKKYSTKPENLSPSTRKVYLDHIKNHILPKFGHMQVDEIKTMHLVDFMESLYQPGARKDGKGEFLSKYTIIYIYSVLRNLFTVAKDFKLIKENPMDGIKKPKLGKKEKKKAKHYEADEAQSVIDALYKEPINWRLFFLGALLGGFRRGELIALEWPDVLFDQNALFIQKNIPFVEAGKPHNAYEKSTKGEEEEVVDMPVWYMNELKIYHQYWIEEKEKVGDAWKGGDNQYVFHGGKGEPMYHTTPTGRWRQFIKDHDLKFIRLHDLRHTSATLLIEEGASMKAIQERLRHKQYQTTANIYAHVTKKVSRDLADKFNLFNPKQKNPVPNSSSPTISQEPEDFSSQKIDPEENNYLN